VLNCTEDVGFAPRISPKVIFCGWGHLVIDGSSTMRPPPAFNADPRGIAGPTLRTKAKATGCRLLANRCDEQAISRSAIVFGILLTNC
jgi:hypothetical protein